LHFFHEGELNFHYRLMLVHIACQDLTGLETT